MNRAKFRIAFDGEALASHSMDVRHLAPSLLALGDILVESNRIFNRKSAELEINVTPDIEAKCFDIGLELIQHWGYVKKLVEDENIASAKQIIEWVLIGGAGIGLLRYMIKLRGKKPINIILFRDENGNNLYRYQFDGRDDEILDEKMHKLYQSNKIRSGFLRLLRPVDRQPGIEEFIVYKPEEKEKAVRVNKDDLKNIDFSNIEEDQKLPESLEEPFEATLRVYSPVYDNNAPKWRFWLGPQHHYMDVSDSNIRDVVI